MTQPTQPSTVVVDGLAAPERPRDDAPTASAEAPGVVPVATPTRARIEYCARFKNAKPHMVPKSLTEESPPTVPPTFEPSAAASTATSEPIAAPVTVDAQTTTTNPVSSTHPQVIVLTDSPESPDNQLGLSDTQVVPAQMEVTPRPTDGCDLPAEKIATPSDAPGLPAAATSEVMPDKTITAEFEKLLTEHSFDAVLEPLRKLDDREISTKIERIRGHTSLPAFVANIKQRGQEYANYVFGVTSEPLEEIAAFHLWCQAERTCRPATPEKSQSPTTNADAPLSAIRAVLTRATTVDLAPPPPPPPSAAVVHDAVVSPEPNAVQEPAKVVSLVG